MTDKERDELYETIRHNSEKENHWKAQRYFWVGTVLVSMSFAVATIITVVYKLS